MASLTGNKIKDTYPGLIKTDDNAIVGATEKQITDGEGNAIPMSMGTSGVSFTGDADFSAATVTGLPEAGLESGTGTDSMQSAASLTTVAANAAGDQSIALGNAACAPNPKDIIIGAGAYSVVDSGTTYSNIVIGDGAKNDSIYGGHHVIIGYNAVATTNEYNVVIGRCASSSRGQQVIIGDRACGGTNYHAVAIGTQACATGEGAVALGQGVTAAKADTVTVKELETCVAGGGVYLTTPDGLAQPKLTVNNSSELLIGGNPIGAAGLVNGTGADSLKNADSLVTTPAVANGCNSIALGNNASACGIVDTRAIAIGNNSCVTEGGLAIGDCARVFGNSSLAIGHVACASGFDEQIAIGLFSVSNSNAGGIAIGRCASARGLNASAIGRATISWYSSFAAGYGACAGTASYGEGVAVGYNARAFHRGTTALGDRACVTGERGIAIGSLATTAVTDGIAIGCGVVGARSNVLTSFQFEATTLGKGIIVTSPDGLTTLGIGIDNSGNVVTYTV